MIDATTSPSGAVDGTSRVPVSAAKAVAVSVAGHIVMIAAAIFFTRLTLPAPLPPAYSVELIAAPAGPRALGAVTQGPTIAAPSVPAAVAPEAAPTIAEEGTALAAKRPTARLAARPAAKAAVKPAVQPTTKPAVVMPKPTALASGGDVSVPGKSAAGGGPTGGRGGDVASVKVQGIAFPFPGYLENITRQIALNFKPRPGVDLRAEVSFLIRRDGSVAELRLVSRSGVYAFDLECIGAVEAVGQRRSFGALPSGFRDDVLPVVFSFDPTVLR